MSRYVSVSNLGHGVVAIDPNGAAIEIDSVEQSMTTYHGGEVCTHTVTGTNCETGKDVVRVVAIGEKWRVGV